MPVFYVGPFKRIVLFHLGEPPVPYFYLTVGEEISGGQTTRGVGGGLIVPGTDPERLGEMEFHYRNPGDPAWVASMRTITTSQGVGSPTMQLNFTGTFEDSRAGVEDPNDMPWLDGLSFSMEGYSVDPLTLGPPGGAFSGLSRQSYDGFRTGYAWVNFPDTGAIPLLALGDPHVTEDSGPERFQMTYPGWEDYFGLTA
jgi:hypothetical protein